jgi:alkylation response protein AidB-like acyl-CoA dehydrogenase
VNDISAEDIRSEVRGWLTENFPPDWTDAIGSGDDAAFRKARVGANSDDLQRLLGDAGWATPQWAPEYGGRGLGSVEAKAVAEELRRYRVPRQFNVIGLAMAAPTLLEWGTEEQKRRHLPPLARYEEKWCQLFSEPGAGSDLAGLATRAVREQGGWRINGQKVWSSMAHEATHGLLLARTDPNAPKHKGITYFILDMSLPGVEVRPLRQMTGESEFNEVFFADVLVPDEQRIGPVDGGWSVAITTLMNERSALSGAGSVSGSSIGGFNAESVLRLGVERDAWGDSALRQELARVLIDSRLIKAGNERSAAARRGGGVPGPEGSITKLMAAEHNKRVQALAIAALGSSAIAWGDGNDGDEVAGVVRGFLRSQANTIEGGTSEVMRNVIADRVLRLPKEDDPTRTMPWAQVPRS